MQGTNVVRRFLMFLCAAQVITSPGAEVSVQSPSPEAVPAPALTLEAPATNIWQSGVGEGFRSSVYSFGLSAGGAVGFAAFGSEQAHDLVLSTLSYGHMLGGVKGVDHWYRGNWEFRCELFGGVQIEPSSEWLIGLTPHLRYDFATGTRWIPFIDGGFGVTATSIGPPDLSNTFEFNLQGGFGVSWFIKDNFAVTVETRYLHMSCAGISKPNLGLNSVMGMLGVSWLF